MVVVLQNPTRLLSSLTISSECLDKGDFTIYASVIKLAATTSTRRLYVYLINPILACPPELRALNWIKVQTLSTFMYSTKPVI